MDDNFVTPNKKVIGRHKSYAHNLSFKPSEVLSPQLTRGKTSTLEHIKNLENRLNSCDSVYKLSCQTQQMKSKERKEKIHLLKKALSAYKHSVGDIEKQDVPIPTDINSIIRSEIEEFMKTKASRELSDLYKEVQELSNENQTLMKSSIAQYSSNLSSLKKCYNSSSLSPEEAQILAQIESNQKELEKLIPIKTNTNSVKFI